MSASKLVYLSNKYYLLSQKTGGIAQLLKNINRVIYGCDISFKISIGNNLKLPHQGLGVVIGPNVVIGDSVTIFQNVTLGAKANGEKYKAPIIGDNVMSGAGACILGSIKVGNNVKIGANSVVLTDIPDNCVAVGALAQIKKWRN